MGITDLAVLAAASRWRLQHHAPGCLARCCLLGRRFVLLVRAQVLFSGFFVCFFSPRSNAAFVFDIFLAPLFCLILVVKAQQGVRCDGLTNITTTGSGFISDGSGPGNYSSSQMCIWSFSLPAGFYVVFDFRSFQTECGFDMLYIFDGGSSDDPLLGVFSGDWTEPDRQLPRLSTHGSQALIIFAVDLYLEANGFELSYIATRCPYDCSGRGVCEPVNGTCTCLSNYAGDYCEIDTFNTLQRQTVPCTGRTRLCTCPANFTTTQASLIGTTGGFYEVLTPQLFCNQSTASEPPYMPCSPCENVTQSRMWQQSSCYGLSPLPPDRIGGATGIFVFAFLLILILSVCGLVALVMVRFRRGELPPNVLLMHMGPREGDLRPPAPIARYFAVLGRGASKAARPVLFPLVFVESGLAEPLQAAVIEMPLGAGSEAATRLVRIGMAVSLLDGSGPRRAERGAEHADIGTMPLEPGATGAAALAGEEGVLLTAQATAYWATPARSAQPASPAPHVSPASQAPPASQAAPHAPAAHASAPDQALRPPVAANESSDLEPYHAYRRTSTSSGSASDSSSSS